jgi:hypothetical protein
MRCFSGHLPPFVRCLAACVLFVALFTPAFARATIPATPVMTLYEFSGNLDVPYYTIESFEARGASRAAGTLAQGSSVIPCLVIKNGKALTDASGTPYVGFKVVVDAREAGPASAETFQKAVEERRSLAVRNHHCDGSVKYVINVRELYDLEKTPFFDPPAEAGYERAGALGPAQGELDEVVRAFHDSRQCEQANRFLIGRRDALAKAWEGFISEQGRRWPKAQLERAKHLDYTMRTAIYEAHLDRGCSAYGACERNIVALSIRNRGRKACSRYQGCVFPDDFQGVSSKISQYNIWDEFLAQISGLTSCFLSSRASHRLERVRRMYEQNVGDVQVILFGDDRDLTAIFPGNALGVLTDLRHYYHAPAMGKCFPQHERVEYISGAVAQQGDDFALIANTRIKVGASAGEGYRFKEFVVKLEDDRDVIAIEDNYPGFTVDSRKVGFGRSSRCAPYGIPPGCPLKKIERYRKTPTWLRAGQPVAISCAVRDRGTACAGEGEKTSVRVGGACDTQMRPVVGVR